MQAFALCSVNKHVNAHCSNTRSTPDPQTLSVLNGVNFEVKTDEREYETLEVLY